MKQNEWNDKLILEKKIREIQRDFDDGQVNLLGAWYFQNPENDSNDDRETIPSCIDVLVHKVFALQFGKIRHCLRQHLPNGFRIVSDTCK